MRRCRADYRPGILALAALLLPLAASALAVSPAKADTLCDLDAAACDSRSAEAPEAARALPVEAIRRIVHDYLIEHPEVLLEAEQALRAKRAEEEARRDQAAIREHRDALFADPEAPVAGNPDGALALVEFFDYRCGYCRRVKPVLDTLLAENGDLRLIHKEFPILGPESTLAARAALASRAQGGYAAFHDALMGAEEPLDHARVFETARAVGLDAERLARDMADPAVDAALARNAVLAEALGIAATPSFVIGERVVRGAPAPAQFRAIVEDARAE